MRDVCGLNLGVCSRGGEKWSNSQYIFGNRAKSICWWLDVGCEEKRGAKHDFTVYGLSKDGVDTKWDGEVSGGKVWEGTSRILFWTCYVIDDY